MTPSEALKLEELADQGAQRSGEAEDRYESQLVEEARRIVSGESILLPSVEHLRVLLTWLDGKAPPEAPWGSRYEAGSGAAF